MPSSSRDRDRFDASRAVDRGRKAGKRLINAQIEQRSTQLGVQVSQTAAAIRDVGSALDKRGQGPFATSLTDALATYVERVGTYLEKADARTLGRDFEAVTRRQPVAVGAAAFLGGFVASRILRVSSTSHPTSFDSSSPSS